MNSQEPSISVDLGGGSSSTSKSTTTIATHTSTRAPKNNRSFFFVEMLRDQGKQPLPELCIGYSRNIYAWVRNFRAQDAVYLLILEFSDADSGRTFWRALQDLPDLRSTRTGTATTERHKHTFPIYRIRARKMATLVAQLAAQSPYQNQTEIVRDLREFMV